jgi:hypothetical protein
LFSGWFRDPPSPGGCGPVPDRRIVEWRKRN